MTDRLVVRVYNVRFGDAILVTVPDRDPATGTLTTRRILIDVGNAPLVASAEGGDDEAFKPVIEDILAQLDGQPLDLYVLTHEHLDHAQGLPHAAWKIFPEGTFLERFKVDHVWLTASAEGDAYYARFPEAKKQKLAFEEQLRRLQRFMADRPELQGLYASYLANNDSTKTSQCVKFLRELNPAATTYVFRGVELGGTHPFREATFEIWAPEEDTSEYYGHFQPLQLMATEAADTPTGPAREPSPPPGVDLGSFLNLVEAMRSGIPDNLLAIDKAANNTSVVFRLQWRGWSLLFAGDAEVRSWKTMQREGVIKPVHFLKVSHHGSHNGTPEEEIFDALLPAHPADGRPRTAAISTWTDTYSGIPHAPTNVRLGSRCTLLSTLDDTQRLFYEVSFEGSS
jgi:beta-lactamase superfamily II metal-dependent hydrolase